MTTKTAKTTKRKVNIPTPIQVNTRTLTMDIYDIARYRGDGLQNAIELFKLPGLQGAANAQNIVTVADVFAKYMMQEINVQPAPQEGQAAVTLD